MGTTELSLVLDNIFSNLCTELEVIMYCGIDLVLGNKMKNKNFLGIICLFLSVFCFGQDSLKTITAEPGDGILSLLRKQGVDPYEVFDEFVALNTDNLRDSVHLIAGRTYVMPLIKLDTVAIVDSLQIQAKEVKEIERTSYDIFGEKYKTVLTKSKRLEGNVYYLVSGHGGPDPGAMGMYAGKAIAEDEYAYDITLRLAKELMSHGAEVYIIIQDENDGIRDERVLEIDHDEVAYPDKTIPLNQLARLKQRVDIINDLYKDNRGKYQRLIVTHVDSRSEN
ncbi:MAG: N-acetylmuramoyl-L-alanine amidase, partial [Maribacter sp.]